MEKPLARCFLTKITKMTPGINVKIPAADRIEILAIKTLATLVMIAPIGFAYTKVKALDNKISTQENKKQKNAVTAIPGEI